MKAKTSYLSGKSVFTVSLIVIGLTALTVYLSGIHFHRSLTTNFYLSLGIIGLCLFLFITYGLYQGVAVIDDFSKSKALEVQPFQAPSGEWPSIPGLPSIGLEEGIGGLVAAILFWVAFSIAIFLLLLFWEVVFWYSLILILSMLYWVFFRALKFVFNKTVETKGNLEWSVLYALGYSSLYTGWMFGLVYLVETLG